VVVLVEAIRGVKVHLLSFWDAMIWATAKQAKMEKIYTEDFQHGRIVEGVSFINPFRQER
jgi:predicted nucleic acid-binding protein